MKKVLLFLIGAMYLLQANAQSDEPWLKRSLTNDNISAAKVETSGGSIQVTGVDAANARIEVYVRPSNSRNKLSKEEIRRKLEKDYTLDIDISGNKLTAIARPKIKKFNWNSALSISFKIYVTQNVSTDLATSGGSIRLSNLSGTHDFRTSGGSMDIEHLSGTIKGRTSGGSIRISHSKDDIDLRTSGGSIHAQSCKGNMELATSGGSLHLNLLDGNINARTSGGSVTGNSVTGELLARTSGGNVNLKEISGSLNASTSGGGISVELLTLGKYLTLTNSGGNVDLTLPGNKGLDLELRGDRINTGTLKNFSGKLKKDEVDGTLNGGGIPVKVRTSGGSVRVAWKD